MIRHILISLLALALLAACGRDDGDAVTTEQSSGVDTARLFERIDADSVFVAANLARLPDELVELFWQPLEDMGETSRETYGELADGIEYRSPLAAALLRELGEIDSRSAFEARGLHSNGRWAMHSISVYPLVHWELADANAFDATLERLAEESGTDLPRRTIDDAELIWVDLGDFGLGIHHDGEILTLGLVPDDSSLLRRLANLDQPADALDPRRLQDFNREHDFSPYGSGYLDFAGLVDRLVDYRNEQSAAGRQFAQLGELAADPACRAELDALFALMPRLSFGLPQVDRRELTATARLETDPAFGRRLARLTDTPANVDLTGTELLSAGMALNLVAARDFGREIVGGWVSNPPQCALFEGIRSQAEDWQLALNRPIPPIVTNIHGFHLNLSRLVLGDTGDVMSGAAPAVQDASGTLTVFMRNPQMLVGMAQMFSPELAGLDLRPGGDPQPLPAGMLPNLGDLETWIALGSGAIGVGAGSDASEKLARAVRETDGDSSLLFGYSLNMAAYAELMASMAESNDAVDLPNMDFFGGFGDIYEEVRISVHLSERGIDFTSTSVLKP